MRMTRVAKETRAKALVAARVAAGIGRSTEHCLARMDLTASQYRLLASLARGTNVPSVLAEVLAMPPPSITSAVDGLVARGFVERTPDDADRRRILHSLTAKGKAALAAADAAVSGAILESLAVLGDPAQTAMALDGLAVFQRAFDEHLTRGERPNFGPP